MFDSLYALLWIGLTDSLGDILQLVCLFTGNVGGILNLGGIVSMTDSCRWEES